MAEIEGYLQHSENLTMTAMRWAGPLRARLQVASRGQWMPEKGVKPSSWNACVAVATGLLVRGWQWLISYTYPRAGFRRFMPS